MSDLIPVAVVVRKTGIYLPQLGVAGEVVEERYAVYALQGDSTEPDEIDIALDEALNGCGESQVTETADSADRSACRQLSDSAQDLTAESEPLASTPAQAWIRASLSKLGYSDDDIVILVVNRYRKAGLDRLTKSEASELRSDLGRSCIPPKFQSVPDLYPQTQA